MCCRDICKNKTHRTVSTAGSEERQPVRKLLCLCTDEETRGKSWSGIFHWSRHNVICMLLGQSTIKRQNNNLCLCHTHCFFILLLPWDSLLFTSFIFITSFLLLSHVESGLLWIGKILRQQRKAFCFYVANNLWKRKAAIAAMIYSIREVTVKCPVHILSYLCYLFFFC